MARLTRQGARNLTAALDNIAQVVQHRAALLGLDKRTATDFAYRCDLLSDAIERTASANFPLPRQAAEKGSDDEGMSVEHGEGGFDPNLIGDEVPGPLEIIEPPSEPWMDSHFTQEKYHVLGELQEAGELGPVHLASLLTKAAGIILAQESDKEEQEEEQEEVKKSAKKGQQKGKVPPQFLEQQKKNKADAEEQQGGAAGEGGQEEGVRDERLGLQPLPLKPLSLRGVLVSRTTRTAQNYVNYQERASEFAVGDVVVPFGYLSSVAGRVVALWPAIGMADVQFTGGTKRYPVEELQRIDANGDTNPPRMESVPGGVGTVPVPTTSPPQQDNVADMAARVAHGFVRNALYWSAPGRKYRLTRSEQDAGCYNCPKCDDSPMRRTVYKRMNGVSERLLGCPACLFLIKEGDILGHDHGGE